MATFTQILPTSLSIPVYLELGRTGPTFSQHRYLPSSSHTSYCGVESLGLRSDLVSKEWNSQIFMNLPVTTVPKCSGSNAKTTGLKHLQVPDMDTSSRTPVSTHVVHHWTDKLLIQQDSIPDRYHSSSLGDDTQLPASEPLSFSIDQYQLTKSTVYQGSPLDNVRYRYK